ncbi:MAG: TIGR00153 family protein, partial [Phycisphaerales bacterium]|nr:TIGR00153 family protein [Phycisphaerales bacterium]
MRGVAKLFGRSPLTPLQVHMEQVEECVDGIIEILHGFMSGMSHEEICDKAKHVSKLEHNADLVKNDIRNSLPRGLFMQVDRATLMAMLADQDSIADKAEDIGVLLSFKAIPLIDPLKVHFSDFIDKNVQAFKVVRAIIADLDELAEMGFGGEEASRVEQMVDQVALYEHEADVIQRGMLQALFANEDDLSKGEFLLWRNLLRDIGGLSNYSEKLANRVRI